MRYNRIFLCFFLLFSLLLSFSACTVALAKERKEDEQGFLDSVCFLGDSTTAHMLSRAPLRDGKDSKQIWASRARYLNLDPKITYQKIICPQNGEEMTIADTARLVKPAYLVITLGIDYGVYYYRDHLQGFRTCYEKLLDAIAEASPETVVVLQSIFPVGKSCRVITNQMVDNANAVVESIAKDRGLIYLNTNTLLCDKDGYLRDEYCFSEDGIHLTEKAYTVIFEHISSQENVIVRG